MAAYRVFRRGFNAANASSVGARPEDCTRHVGTFEAESENAAVDAAIASGVTVYNGQGIWARLEEDCEAEEIAAATDHQGQVLVKYWHGATALEGWCKTVEEIGECLDLHSNSYSPKFFDSEGDELDYESACYVVGGEPVYED